MKETTKKQKMIIAIIILIIIAGIIITATMGLNFDLRFQESKKVELYLGKDFEIKDIKQITNEVMPNQYVIVQKVEVYEDSVSIIAKDINDEQKQNLVNKVNEKYGTEISNDTTEIVTIPHTRGRDLVKPYILPFAISMIIILVYMAVRYRKLGVIKTVLQTIFVCILTQVVLLSIIAITRIPVGRLTMPISVAVYLLTLVGVTSNFVDLENKLKIENESEKEESK